MSEAPRAVTMQHVLDFAERHHDGDGGLALAAEMLLLVEDVLKDARKRTTYYPGTVRLALHRIMEARVLNKLAMLRPHTNQERQAYDRLARGLVGAIRHEQLDLEAFDLNDLRDLIMMRGVGGITALCIQRMPRRQSGSH